MKFRRGVVLAHHPGSFLSDLGGRAFRSDDYLRVEFLDPGVAFLDSGFDLRERVLNVARVLFVGEVLRDVLIRKVAAKPGQVPGEKRNDDEESCENYQRPS